MYARIKIFKQKGTLEAWNTSIFCKAFTIHALFELYKYISIKVHNINVENYNRLETRT